MVTLRVLAMCVAGIWSVAAHCTEAPLMSLSVDASDAPRRLFHSTLTIPVTPGDLTLVYPRWGITTYPAPTVTVSNIVGLRMTAGSRQLNWSRDPVDLFVFRV